MKNSLLIVLLSCFMFSCADKYERKINSHFKKFIFVENLKDYKIEGIKRSQVTKGENEIRVLKSNINELKKEINNNYLAINKAQEEINKIRTGKTYRYAGLNYYSNSPPILDYENVTVYNLDNSLLDFYKVGKLQMIKNKKEFILEKYNNIRLVEKKIKKENLKLDSILKNPNKDILWINSYITIKGEEKTGINRINYFVAQYPNGEIKNLYSY